jgi:NADPH2:quinone reductase
MQKALFVNEIGKPVSLGERTIPEPKEGEVLIKVTSTMSE